MVNYSDEQKDDSNKQTIIGDEELDVEFQGEENISMGVTFGVHN